VVEGGTLLRCYTSQRGIEGSNPSSSAPKAPRLQEQRERKGGPELLHPGPLCGATNLVLDLPIHLPHRVSAERFPIWAWVKSPPKK
jgi:hypothetical protein